MTDATANSAAQSGQAGDKKLTKWMMASYAAPAAPLPGSGLPPAAVAAREPAPWPETPPAIRPGGPDVVPHRRSSLSSS